MTFKGVVSFIKDAIVGKNQDFLSGNIDKAIFILAIPMILEMVMESLFAVVDIYFVSKVSVNAVATVALTESVLMIVYAFAIGLSMAATALVARRIGEKKPEEAAHAAAQTIIVAVVIGAIFAIPGIFFPHKILEWMGASAGVIEEGKWYTSIVLGGNVVVFLLFLINAIFRGAGDAAVAMRVLWIANGINIILDPILIFGWGPIPALGVTGAALATLIGRSIGVAIQIYLITRNDHVIAIAKRHFQLSAEYIRKTIKLSAGGIGQYLIGTLSWLFMVRISAEFGPAVLAGYAIAFRIIMFTILPSWGLANAAATLVGQNLGAKQLERAERSVWRCSLYNMIFLTSISLVFFVWAEELVLIFNGEMDVVKVGAEALKYIGAGYIFFAFGMVIGQAFNGAGDTRTPTIINFFSFWTFEVPLAYVLAIYLGLGPVGIFISIAAAVTLHAVVSVLVFRRGKWKTIQV